VHPVEPELAVQMYFSDMPREEALREIAGCAWHSYLSFTNPLTHAGYKDIPVSYLLCEDDKIVTPAIQKSEIETIERESGQKVDVTSIKASHSAHASAPDKVINWLIDVASKIP
jgi:pimeloyl-ACP methyl ester carboxylesterase